MDIHALEERWRWIMLQNQARYRECGVFWDYKITLDTPDIEYNSWMLLEVEERDY